MPLKFTQSFDDLKAVLVTLANSGQWVELNLNQKQFRHESGAILNWYPSTGTINFQGKGTAPTELEKTVSALLNQESMGASSSITTNGVESSTSSSDPKLSIAEDLSLPFPDNQYSDSELVIALIGAVGTELDDIESILSERIKTYNYSCEIIHVSRDIISVLTEVDPDYEDEYDRISKFMGYGNEIRRKCADNAALAYGVAAKINEIRQQKSPGTELAAMSRTAYIINSLKHPAEVQKLREIYTHGFFAIGVFADEVRRSRFLVKERQIPLEHAQALIIRDADETLPYGQHTSDTFHLSDFFVHYDSNIDKLKSDLWRFLDLIFGKAYITPTFDEFAMFMAFASALRSADLSRQVGAIIARDEQILSTGANDTPRFGGGLYLPQYDNKGVEIVDTPDGRDYMRGVDSNTAEKNKIIQEIVQSASDNFKDELKNLLNNSRLNDITEYGRVVHAEMEAILACSRVGISSKGATLYSTTFPCHNCAKHIIAAGIHRVVFVEPYPKSKALEFHSDSISFGFDESKNMVLLKPFVGVGPRHFVDLFSMKLGAGYETARKDSEGNTISWRPENAKLRMQMLPCSYIDKEAITTKITQKYKEICHG